MRVLADACLALAVVPLAMLAGNLALYRRPRAVGSGRTPSVSVLIPARDEEAHIEAAVRAVLANTGVSLELVVLDDHSTDRTREILTAIDDPRLRVETAPALPSGWSGKQHACWALSAHARNELLVFVDADVRLAPDALGRMAGYMARHRGIGLASGIPRQITLGWSEKLLLPLIHFLLLGYLPIGLGMLSVAPGFGAGCGQLFIARRQAYREAGGHAAIRSSRHDGLTLPRAFRRAGWMTGLFDAMPVATCRMYDSPGLVWEGLTKNATEGMATPVALPIWTAILGLGHVVPLPLMLAAPGPVTIGAFAAGIVTRAVLAIRFRQGVWPVVFHPVSVAALLVVQWASLFRAWRGAPSTWRGRAYPTI